MVRIVKGLQRLRSGMGLTMRGAALAALLAGCGSVPERLPAPPVVVAPVPASAVTPPPVAAAALAQLGVPYRLGGVDPSGFDCSGLVQWAFAATGVVVPRTTEEQFSWFRPVPREELQPGDLVFFRLPQPHVGIYLGAGEFVHAPATGRAVERARLDSPWFILSFAGGGRAPSL
jgi:cell wall-associated NlpC family hydrolase